MKTYFLLLASLTVGAGAFGQGTVTWANNNNTTVRYGAVGTTWSNAVVVPTIVSAVEFVWAELGTPTIPYVPSSGATLTDWLAVNPGWTAIPQSIKSISPVPGRFVAGVITANTATPGALIQAYAIGWTTPSGAVASFDQAVAFSDAYVGFSALFQIDTANPLALPTPEVPTALTSSGYQGFVLNPVIPEPGTLALAGVGAAMLLIFRRRR